MAMMNQNYEAKQLLIRLHNNTIKNMSNSTAHMLAFSVWLLHSLVIIVADALAQAYITGSTYTYQDIALLYAVTFCRLSQDQSWPLRVDKMELNYERLTTTRSTLIPHKGNQFKSNSQVY